MNHHTESNDSLEEETIGVTTINSTSIFWLYLGKGSNSEDEPASSPHARSMCESDNLHKGTQIAYKM